MFELSCHGEAFVTKKLVVFKGKINQDYEDVCRDKTVHIGFNYWDSESFRGQTPKQYIPIWGIWNNKTFPWNENLKYLSLHQIEYFVPFINSLGLQVQWKYTNEIKGGFNETSELFEGAMGEVSALACSKRKNRF